MVCKHIQLRHQFQSTSWKIKENNKLAVSVALILKLTKEANDLAVKAERKNQFKFFSESNAKLKRMDNLKTNSDALKSKVQKLEDQLNKAKTKWSNRYIVNYFDLWWIACHSIWIHFSKLIFWNCPGDNGINA